MPISDWLAHLGIRYWRTRRFWVLGVGRARLTYHTGRDDRARDDASYLGYRCNICGQVNEVQVAQLHREAPTCWTCGSTVRFRAIIHELSLALWGGSLILPSFPVRPDVTGLGLTDWSGYAIPLAQKVAYINTYLAAEPHLDLTDVDPALTETQDFVLASDIFEHIPPPVEMAFRNVFRLLRPNGVLILSAPYTNEGTTVEHFPNLYDWRLTTRGGQRRLENTTRDGRYECFESLCFHGGPSPALEMRVFSRSGLIQALVEAGFAGIRICDDCCLEHGVVWLEDHSLPIVARKPSAALA